jgi:glycosyltransferase involved in cell wall biosynthesis
VVVVDDGSADQSAAVASAIGPPVRVFSTEHLGIGAARSHALDHLRTEVLVTLDADDLLTPRSVEARIDLLHTRSDVDLVFGHGRTFAGCVDAEPVPLDRSRPHHTVGSLLMRREAYQRVGRFATGLRVADGLDWLLRAREAGIVDATVEAQVVWRRVHGANNSLTQRTSLGEFAVVLKASLDRRRRRTSPKLT